MGTDIVMLEVGGGRSLEFGLNCVVFSGYK